MDWTRALRLNLKVLSGVAILLLAFGVRVLSWHDTRLEVGKIQTAVSADYKHVAQLLREGGIRSFLSSSSPLADLNTLGHPPGYSILLAVVYRLFGESDAAVQFVQMVADAIAAVLIFLILAELFPLGAGAIAGLLAALSPQFAWNSVLLLPDSISVLPILIAILLLIRATRNPRLMSFLIIGALIGVSCWLRANAMFLTLFIAAAVPLLVKSKDARRMPAIRPQDAGAKSIGAPVWKFALAVVFGTLLIVLPLTIRNAVVFHRFIPLSLGAGQTLLEGIADYDTPGRFGVPPTDVGIMKQESEIYQRPDYYGTLFNPDGVERERARMSRGFAIIRSHPFWFAGVMARRASSMVRLERSRLISRQPPIGYSISAESNPVTIDPQQLIRRTIDTSPGAKLSVGLDNEAITITGDDSKYGPQASWPLQLQPDSDYIVEVPVKIERGRMRLSIIDGRHSALSTTVVDAIENTAPEQQPLNHVQLPFVATDSQARITLSNEAANPPGPVAKIGTVKIYGPAPARFLWTRYPRFVIHAIQKIFITAVMLPLAIIGLLIVIFQKRCIALVVLTVVPIYFFTVQSIVHTEYRYVLAVTYFLLAFAGIALCHLANSLYRRVVRLSSKVPGTVIE